MPIQDNPKTVKPDGFKIKTLRTQRGWTQDVMVERICALPHPRTPISKRTLENAESGRDVLIATLATIARVLGTDVRDLMITSGTKTPEPALPGATPDRFEKLLLELNRELVRDPDLWGVYDLDQEPHPTPDIKQGDRQLQGKLHAFAYMFLNVFQTVYAFYEAQGKRGVRDAHYNSWYGTFKDFVNKSSWAQRILLRKDSEVVYDAGFLAYAKSLIQNQHGVDRGD